MFLNGLSFFFASCMDPLQSWKTDFRRLRTASGRELQWRDIQEVLSGKITSTSSGASGTFRFCDIYCNRLIKSKRESTWVDDESPFPADNILFFIIGDVRWLAQQKIVGWVFVDSRVRLSGNTRRWVRLLIESQSVIAIPWIRFLQYFNYLFNMIFPFDNTT